MKTNLRSVVHLTVWSILLLSLSPAQSQEAGRFYVKGDAGGTITPDADLEEFFGPVAAGSKVDFDPGIRLGFRAGYGLTDWFAAEAETGIMANSIHSITGASEGDAVMSNVPLLLNARFHYPKWDRLTPYFGGGLGLSTAVLEADDIVIGGTSLDGNMSDVVFAYQVFAGLRYKLNENMGLSLEYRYFATTEPEWEGDVVIGAASDHVRFGRIETHALTIAFDWSF